MLLMVFHVILRQISNCSCCAISSRELSILFVLFFEFFPSVCGTYSVINSDTHAGVDNVRYVHKCF